MWLPRPREAASTPVLVGLSGGLDSTVLLHRLARDSAIRASGLRAVHVNHGLHPDAACWAEHAQALCAALNIECRVVVVRVPHESGLGPEGAARRARRAAFADALGVGETLALAQHRDDQAETVLLRALRASGPDGLAAMRPWRNFAAGWLWRPLLDTPRAALQAYAEREGLRWIDDPSNRDESFDRNWLRHRVLPLLRERWPQADAALARAAALSAEASDLLIADDEIALAKARAQPHGNALSRRALAALAPERRARVLRRWTDTQGLPPLPAEGIARIERDLLPCADDRAPVFAWHGARIAVWRDALYAFDEAALSRSALPPEWSADWDGRATLALPNDDALAIVDADGRARALPWPVRVHARRGGERIRLPGRSHRHTLKHLLQDAEMPPWERARLPVIEGPDGATLAAGDRIVSAELDAWLRAENAELRWHRNDGAPPPREA
ncbi:MAG: tRNA lysidine(34) synthetase TilS [Lysobacter sp.]|nr:MAG: tRNA lysidine(34) synthetase TilS [Lysobacter sp.]